MINILLSRKVATNQSKMKEIHVDDEILLKEISLASSQLIFDSIDRSRKHLGEWLPFVETTKSVDDTRNFIHSVLNQDCAKSDVIFEIWHLHKFAGLIGFKEIDNSNKKTEIGYWIDAAMTGKGIMHKACKSMISYAFHHLKLNRVMIKVAVENTKSKNIPISLGFTLEGVERDGELIHDRFHDLAVFSLLKYDWKI